VIVLASDYVGLEVVRLLLQRGDRVDAVVLDPSDRGGYNSEIGQLLVSARSEHILASSTDLDEPGFMDALDALHPTIGILAWWPRIIAGRLVSLPARGWVNFHPSLLPFNRGKHPNFWCLAEGTPCGVSLHFVGDGVDAGPVIAQALVQTTWEDTGETVYLKCRERVLGLFRDNIEPIISGELTGEPQDGSVATFHRAAELEPASIIDLDAPTTARRLLNLTRARTFPPHPAATFKDGDTWYSVRVSIEAVPDDE
jgi:methionyl-tRNA formyltransferase